MEHLLQDIRQAFRLMRRSPGFTLAAVAALAIGIGANTAIFSVINTVLLKPLPYPDPGRLMVFTNTSPAGEFPGASPTKFNIWRQQTAVFDDVSAFHFTLVNLTGGEPEQIRAGQVSADFFRLFGAQTIAGRTFSAADDRPHGGQLVVLSNGFWKRRFGGDRAIVGRTIALDGDGYEVIGVLAPFDTTALEGPNGAPDVWIPFQLDPASTMQGHYFNAAGRLKSGVTPGQADAQLQLAANEFRRRFPDAMNPKSGFGTLPIQEIVVRNVRSSLWVLLGAVVFVLLIACANVANLLLVRANARQREIAIRAALGAGRGRIARQLLTESVVLSLVGGAIGLVLGVAGIRALLALNPGNIPRIGQGGAAVVLDWRVLAFTIGLSVLTGIVFGLVPALHASRPDLNLSLKESNGRSGSGFRQNKMRAALVMSEMALALLLLIGSALFIRTFIALRTVDPGFDPHQVLTLRMSLTGTRFEKTAAVAQVMRAATDQLRALPGVEAAGASCCIPLEGGLGLPFTIIGRPSTGPFTGGASYVPISPGYFRAFRIPILRGRAFTERDAGGTPGVVIINEAMAKRYWPKGDPLKDQIEIAKGGGPQFAEPPRQIVGIVGDVRGLSLSRDPDPAMYIPWAQMGDLNSANTLNISPLAWIVRTRVPPASLTRAIEATLRTASGGLPVASIRSMDEVLVRSTARSTFDMWLLTIFAGSALLLAAIGIYGLMAYSVQQRTQEIGIRLALGADAPTVRNMVVFHGMSVALAGVAIGLLAAFGLTRVIASFLFGVTSKDPAVFVIVPVLLAAVALAGVWLPARRAARIDPAVALREE
jgi:predicted permease